MISQQPAIFRKDSNMNQTFPKFKSIETCLYTLNLFIYTTANGRYHSDH